MGSQGKAGDLLKKTMATAAVKTANDKAQALCAKVDAGTNTAADLDTIRTEKKVVYDVSNRKNNALGEKNDKFSTLVKKFPMDIHSYGNSLKFFLKKSPVFFLKKRQPGLSA